MQPQFNPANPTPHFSTHQNQTQFCSLVAEMFNMVRHPLEKEQHIETWYLTQKQLLVQKQRADELNVQNFVYPHVTTIPRQTSQQYKSLMHDVSFPFTFRKKRKKLTYYRSKAESKIKKSTSKNAKIAYLKWSS